MTCFEKCFRSFCIGLVAVLFLSTFAMGQTSPTGGLSGVITDPSRAVIPNAAVQVKSEETGLVRKSKSNAEGYWEVRVLPVGKYQVEIEAAGFQRLVQTGIAVEAAVVSWLPAELPLGAVSETVTVVGEDFFCSHTAWHIGDAVVLKWRFAEPAKR